MPDGTAALGPSDVSFNDRGYLTIGLGAEPAQRDELPEGGQKMAKLFSFEPGKGSPRDTLRTVADLGAFEAAQDSDGGGLDTNPQSVQAMTGFAVVSDAGANALLKVRKDGVIETLAVFPQRTVDAPDGTQISMDPVPAGVVFHKGAFYVAELTGFPFPKGGANIYKVVPGEAPVVVAGGSPT